VLVEQVALVAVVAAVLVLQAALVAAVVSFFTTNF
jgi:hypothetical protein